MNISHREGIVKKLSSAISKYLREKNDLTADLSDEFEENVGKIISGVLPKEPTSAELLENIQAMGVDFAKNSELQKAIALKESELEHHKKLLGSQNSAIENYKAEIKALINSEAKKDKSIVAINDKHLKELKALENKYQASLKSLEDKRDEESKAYASSLESISEKNTRAFGRISDLKEIVIRTEASVADSNEKIQSINEIASLTRKSQKKDGLNPRQISQIMRISNHSMDQASKNTKVQVDRLAKAAMVLGKNNSQLKMSVNLLESKASLVDSSAEIISKSANVLSNQIVDIKNVSSELKKESVELNKLPLSLANTIESVRRDEIREMKRFNDSNIEFMKSTYEQNVADLGSVLMQTRSFIEDAKKDVNNDKLGAHRKMEQRFSLLLDQFETSSIDFVDASKALKSVDASEFEKSHSRIKVIATALASFLSETKADSRVVVASIENLTSILESALGGES